RRGRKAAPRMGRLLVDRALHPDLIITSTARRAVATARAVADALATPARIVERRDLYLAEPSVYVDRLRELDHEFERVLVVGHNPGIEQLVGILTASDNRMPTAAIAVIELPIDTWAALGHATRGKLRARYKPKDLD